MTNPSVYEIKPCTIEHKCPWGVAPVVGMWKQFPDGSQLFATNCLSRFTGCPRLAWSERKWKVRYQKKLRDELFAEVPLMKCANVHEFRWRLDKLSEGMLSNHMNEVRNYTINQGEIETYKRFKERGLK